MVPLLREQEVHLVFGGDASESLDALHHRTPCQRLVQLERMILWQLLCVHQMERLCFHLYSDTFEILS